MIVRRSVKVAGGGSLVIACDCGSDVVLMQGDAATPCATCGALYEWKADGRVCPSCSGECKAGSGGKAVCPRCGIRGDCCG